MTPTRTVGPLDARRGSTGGVESAVVLLPIGVCIGLLALVWPSPGVTTLALAAGLLVPGVATAALLRRRDGRLGGRRRRHPAQHHYLGGNINFIKRSENL